MFGVIFLSFKVKKVKKVKKKIHVCDITLFISFLFQLVNLKPDAIANSTILIASCFDNFGSKSDKIEN